MIAREVTTWSCPYMSAAQGHSGTGEASLPEAGKAKLLVTGAR
jgi:hypothetical protein